MSILIYENKTLVSKQDLGLYSGDIAVTPDKLNGHPRLNWSGSIIDLDQFRIALSFLKWTHDTHRVEGQIRLFYNEVTRKWKTVALPQYIWSAGHTREVEENDPVKSAIIEELLNSGFGQAGTGHHHSNMSAFQSGGDKDDELSQNGFHFTVGRMDAQIADFHCRATFRKINYDPKDGMLDPNQWLPGLHNRVIQDKEIAWLWLNLTHLPPFPETWKTYLVKKPEPVAAVWPPPQSSTGPSSFGFASHLAATTPKPVAEKIEMYRDGNLCIYFKPSDPVIQFRLIILPKRAQMKPAEPPAAQPSQAEINQKKLEELEKARAKDAEEFGELADRVASMTQNEYEDFCQKLRNAALKRLAARLPANDLSTPRGRVLERLEECLAEFRDIEIPNNVTKPELQDICEAMQDLSCRIVKDIEQTATQYYRLDSSTIEEPQLRELLIKWGSALFDGLLHPSTPCEWKAMEDECKLPVHQAVDFYRAMLTGLQKGITHEIIDPVYNTDGVYTAPDTSRGF